MTDWGWCFDNPKEAAQCIDDAAAQIAELQQKINALTQQDARSFIQATNKIAKLEEFNQECRQALLRCNEQIAKLEETIATLNNALTITSQGNAKLTDELAGVWIELKNERRKNAR